MQKKLYFLIELYCDKVLVLFQINSNLIKWEQTAMDVAKPNQKSLESIKLAVAFKISRN